MIIAHNPNTLYLNQSFNRYAVDYDGMQGLQKLKCATCGTMFMSETETNTCPSCSEQNHTHHEHWKQWWHGWLWLRTLNFLHSQESYKEILTLKKRIV